MGALASCKWRFEFSVTKCAVLIFGHNTKEETFYLGNEPIISSNMYSHVGVNLLTKGSINLNSIKEDVNSSKRAFYALIGQSLPYTNYTICYTMLV